MAKGKAVTAMEESLYEPKNYAKRVKDLLRKCKFFELRIGPHVKKQRMPQRQIKIGDVWENLENPTKLQYAKKRKKPRKHEENYKCYFKMSGQQVHIYGVIFNFKEKFIKLATVIKNRPRQQRKIKYGKN